MYEYEVIHELKSSGIDIIVSLPCDKNKGFTDMIHEYFRVVDITREEDGVGICAGIFLAGHKPIMSIQSSGIGNMMNAIMSLTSYYDMPLPILASWRGVDNEKIQAQIPFNSHLPDLLDCYGIEHVEILSYKDIPSISAGVCRSFSDSKIIVFLIHPTFWKESKRLYCTYPNRSRHVRMTIDKFIPNPIMTRLEAIKAVVDSIGDNDIVVSNIGMSSKELFASRKDSLLNFYMLGSYTQATPIGLGIAICTKRYVFVIDGDGSLLGSSIFPILASEHPNNLIVICMDNGTFGSTGNQINPAYSIVDIGTVASGYGLDVITVNKHEEIPKILSKTIRHMIFVQVIIQPLNSNSEDVDISSHKIKSLFMKGLSK